MKLVTFMLILICCNVWAAKINFSKYGNKMIEDFLEKFKTTLKTGSEKLGIPVLDPFNADQFEIKLNEEMIKLDGLLTKINVEGLSEYDIINGDYSMSEIIVLKLHLSWPLVAGRTNYSIKGKADNFEIYGKGEIEMSAQSFAFDTEINCKLDGGISGYLKLTDMKLKLSLKSLNFRATGLFDDDDLSAILSAVISDMAPEFISSDEVVSMINLFISKKLEAFFSTKTFLEILNMLLQS